MTTTRRVKRAKRRPEIEARDVKRRSKTAAPRGSKATDATLKPSKNSQRTRRLAGGLRASLNRRKARASSG